jgi:NADH dehydrogenase FAD-containing subunit
MRNASQQSSVVVIGGGYGGVTLARALDEHAHVILVEPKDTGELQPDCAGAEQHD